MSNCRRRYFFRYCRFLAKGTYDAGREKLIIPLSDEAIANEIESNKGNFEVCFMFSLTGQRKTEPVDYEEVVSDKTIYRGVTFNSIYAQKVRVLLFKKETEIYFDKLY